jgi:metallo-beta-lactamase family protein
LKHRLGDDRSSVLFVGYQSEGTRGRRLLEGEKQVKLLGELIDVRAKILNISGFSAHADWHEMLQWMEGFETPPKQTLLVHGETSALEALRQKVAAKGWPVAVPRHLEKVELVEA